MSLCLGFIACDDNDENDDSVNTSIVVNPAKVFTGGLPNLFQACLFLRIKMDW